jgi:hypothetical protein
VSEYCFITTKQELIDELSLAEDIIESDVVMAQLNDMPKNTVRILSGDNGYESDPCYSYYNAEQLRKIAAYLNKLADDIDKDKAAD